MTNERQVTPGAPLGEPLRRETLCRLVACGVRLQDRTGSCSLWNPFGSSLWGKPRGCASTLLFPNARRTPHASTGRQVLHLGKPQAEHCLGNLRTAVAPQVGKPCTAVPHGGNHAAVLQRSCSPKGALAPQDFDDYARRWLRKALRKGTALRKGNALAPQDQTASPPHCLLMTSSGVCT
jgi:hypothetical protein